MSGASLNLEEVKTIDSMQITLGLRFEHYSICGLARI